MKLLIAGDSFALFDTPLQPDYNNLDNRPAVPVNNNGCLSGVSFGELIAKELSMEVESSGCSGAAIPMCVLKALRHITDSHKSNEPISHCIFHITQYNRITSNNNPKMHNSLLNYNISREQYFNYSKSKFFDLSSLPIDYTEIIQEHLSPIDFEAGNLAISDTDNLEAYIKDVPVAKILSDNIAYLSLLESCCKLNNIKLLIFSVFVPFAHLCPTNKLFNLYNLSYATLYQPVRTWGENVDDELAQHKFSRDQLVLIRNGNHMYPQEHAELAKGIIRQNRNFFR